ncbi:MAG: 3,4-dihydroxy-2-butanone-4-phosphate synthase [Phycisphaerales bacterium]|nr:3,4-dihydroxy-2-butanone-4-phosphate synthase [Phycisphaerales bacterium]
MLSPIPEILEDLKQGRMIILVDDERRENEGDFVCAAEHVNVDMVNFMTRIGGGYLCVAMANADCERLDLHPQVSTNTSLRGTPLTISVDGSPKHGVGTGISANDRATTIKLLANPNSTPDDFVRPGHINPLHAREGGVLARTGQTEGSVDLCRMAGLRPAAAIIEIVRQDGEMARMPDLEEICKEHSLKMCSVEQIIEQRLAHETLVTRTAPREGTPIQTPWGTFNLLVFNSTIDAQPHLALTLGDVGQLDGRGNVIEIDDPVMVRVHRRDVLGDIFHAGDSPSGDLLRASMKRLQQESRGALIYLRPEHMGDDLTGQIHKIQRPEQDDPNRPDLTRGDGVAGRAQPMDTRNLGIGSQLLRELGLSKLRLLVSKPREYPALHGFGLEIVEQVALSVSPQPA